MRQRFYYFLSGVTSVSERTLQDAGLWSRFADDDKGLIGYSVAAVQGPDNSPGVIVAIGAHPAEYIPERQFWEDAGGFWIGVDKQAFPGPGDLVRELGIAGYETPLAGALWRIPLIRRWDAARVEHVSALPKTLIPRDGRMCETVTAKYQEADKQASQIWRSFLTSEALSIEIIFDICVGLLAMNYRIGGPEVGLLGLLDPDAIIRVMGLAVDLPGIELHRSQMTLDGLEAAIPAEDE